MSNNGGDVGPSGQRNINTIIGYCMWTSLGLVMIALVGIHHTEAVRDARYIIGLIVIYTWHALLILATCILLRFIRRREKFHRAQLVFWPSRCRHCADALIAPQSSIVNILTTDHEENLNTDSNSVETSTTSMSSIDAFQSISRNGSNPCTEENGSENDRTSGNLNSVMLSLTSNIHGAQSSSRFKIHTTNRAVVNVFIILSVIYCMGALDNTIGAIACYVQGQISVVTFIEATVQLLIDFVFVSVAIVFSACYYDAKFVRTFQNIFMLLLLTALSIWITIIDFSSLFRGLTDQQYESDNSTAKCRPNTTFTIILRQIDLLTEPFFAEASVIALGLLTHLWRSFVPKPSLQVQDRHFAYRLFERKGIANMLYRLTSNIRRSCRMYLTSRQFGESDNHLLRREHSRSGRLSTFVRANWSLSFILNALIFAVSMFLMFGSDDFGADNKDVYLRWCIEIAAYL